MTEGNGGQATLIEETLKPLIEKREEIDREVVELEQRTAEKREERKSVERILRAGGLLEKAPYPGGRPAGIKNGQAKIDRASEPMMAIAYEKLPQLAGRDFTTRDLADLTGKDLSTNKKMIEGLREDGVVRLVGLKHPEGAPGHVKAAHYALIKKG